MTVVVGGVGNIAGTVAAAVGIGTSDNILQQLLGSPVLGKIIVLGVIILFLQWKPGGLIFDPQPQSRLTHERFCDQTRGDDQRHLCWPSSWFSCCRGSMPGRRWGARPTSAISRSTFTASTSVMPCWPFRWTCSGATRACSAWVSACSSPWAAMRSGMYLMLMIGKLGQYHSDLPDFMVFLGYPRLPGPLGPVSGISGSPPRPWCWVPGVVALIFGWFAFRSRIRGVYFSILTQALTYAACLMFFRNDFTFGGNNGLTDFKFIVGHDLRESGDPAGALPGDRASPVCDLRRLPLAGHHQARDGAARVARPRRTGCCSPATPPVTSSFSSLSSAR